MFRVERNRRKDTVHECTETRSIRPFLLLNLDNLYTRPGFAGLYGVSGVGHLFQPGVLDGSAPAFSLVGPGGRGFDPGIGHFDPSFGMAYRIPKGGVLRWLTGDDSVIRGGEIWEGKGIPVRAVSGGADANAGGWGNGSLPLGR